jgi:xanthosine utilization system XapX-like protein
MTLGTHAVVGAAVATLFPSNPVLAFVGGFLSHFVLDAIPHWDYKILSLESDQNDKLNTDMKIGKFFFLDLFRIGADISIGIILTLLLFRNTESFPFILLVGSAGAIIPDFLQFMYFKVKTEPLRTLQKFHLFAHANENINHRPVLGISCQVLVIVTSYFLVYLIL